MKIYEAYCKTLRAERREAADREMIHIGVVVKGIKAENEEAAAEAVKALNPELRVLAVREALPEPEWPQNLGNEELVNDYRASLMLGSKELTEALREEILRRMGEEEQR